MTPKEIKRFLEIFLTNNQEYTGITIVLHDKNHVTEVATMLNQIETTCNTMLMLDALIEQIVQKLNDIE